MAIRNALEEIHGGGIEHSLTDEQMRRINPLVRNAVLSTLHAFDHADQHPAAQSWLNFEMLLIPDYWEEPEFNSDYLGSWDSHPTPEHPPCMRCGRPVFKDLTGRWTHIHPDGCTDRTCRSASFDENREGLWDYSIPGGWQAKGPRNG